MRNFRLILAIVVVGTVGCAPADDEGSPGNLTEVCTEFQYLEVGALETLRFKYPVEVSNVGFFFCPCASITLTDASGDMEHFSLSWDLMEGINSGTLYYDPIGPEMFAENGDALVDASLVLMGSWLARTFTLNEIGLLATTRGPSDCKANEPEMIARLVLGLANQPRYHRIVEAIACADESMPVSTTHGPPESRSIQVANLAEVSKRRQPRPAGLLLEQEGTNRNDQE